MVQAMAPVVGAPGPSGETYIAGDGFQNDEEAPMKEKRQSPDLRMSAAAFDDAMRRAFQVSPPVPKKGKRGHKKKGGKKA